MAEPQVIVFTGCNAGIGFYAAGNLAARGHKIVAGVRSQQKYDVMVKEVTGEFGAKAAGNFEFVAPLDQSSFTSVQQFATAVLKQYARIDVLCCNAGVSPGLAWFAPDQLDKETGIDKTFMTNYLSAFLLTLSLLPKLQESKARVVFTSSGLHRDALVEKLDLVKKERDPPLPLYDEGMLCKIAITYELYRRFGKTGMTFHSYNPGGTATKLLAEGNDDFDRVKGCLNTPQKSGLTLLNACINPALSTGEPRYLQAYRLAGCKHSFETWTICGGVGERTLATIPSNDCMNPGFQKKNWEDSIKLLNGAGVAVSLDGVVQLSA